MMRVVRLTTLFLIVMALASIPAQANIWDWLGELSGPGPFHSRGNITFTVYCWHGDVAESAEEGTTGEARNAKWFHVLQDRKAKGPCLFFDTRGLEVKNPSDSRFFPTRLEIYEGGPTYRLW